MSTDHVSVLPELQVIFPVHKICVAAIAQLDFAESTGPTAVIDENVIRLDIWSLNVIDCIKKISKNKEVERGSRGGYQYAHSHPHAMPAALQGSSSRRT